MGAGAAINPGNEFLAIAKASALSAMTEKKSGRAKDSAQKGIEAANSCIKAYPNEAGCYYWRAVNTGLYHKHHIIGYQRGVKQMIEDCKKVIALDPAYDNGGAYRMLGQIYTQLPQTGGTAESVVRDLPLAENYLREAIKVSPDYPENYITLTETLIEEEKPVEATSTLATARSLAPKWQQDVSYKEWHIFMGDLEKKISKQKK